MRLKEKIKAVLEAQATRQGIGVTRALLELADRKGATLLSSTMMLDEVPGLVERGHSVIIDPEVYHELLSEAAQEIERLERALFQSQEAAKGLRAED